MFYKTIKILPVLFMLCLLCACGAKPAKNNTAPVSDAFGSETFQQNNKDSGSLSLSWKDLFGERIADITLPESIPEGQSSFPVYIAGNQDITLYCAPDTTSAIVQALPNIEPQSYSPGVRFSKINGSFTVYAQQGEWAFCSWAGKLGWVALNQLEPRRFLEGRLDTQDAAFVYVPSFWNVPLQVYYACAAQMYDTYLAEFSFGALLTEIPVANECYYYDEAYPSYEALYQSLQSYFSADILEEQLGTDSTGWPKPPFSDNGHVKVIGELGRGISVLYGVEQFDPVAQMADSVCARIRLSAYDWIEAQAKTPVEGHIILRKEADGGWRFTQLLSELDSGHLANEINVSAADAALSRQDINVVNVSVLEQNLYQKFLMNYLLVSGNRLNDNQKKAYQIALLPDFGPYTTAPTDKQKKEWRTQYPGCDFLYVISIDQLNLAMKQLYGISAPTLTAADFPDSPVWESPRKDPTFTTCDGMQISFVFIKKLDCVLVCRKAGSDTVYRLDALTNQASGATAAENLLTTNSFYIARGEYRDRGFYLSADGSVFVVIDKYGEIQITEEDYNKLCEAYRNQQNDFNAFQTLIFNTIQTYAVQCSQLQLSLKYETEQNNAPPVLDAISVDRVTSMDVEVNNDTFLGATQVFKNYYLSYLSAINALDGSLTQYCTETQCKRQEARIFKYNADWTFENQHLYIDAASFTLGYENDILTAHYNVRCENDANLRAGGKHENNVALQQVTAQYHDETDTWYIASAILDNKISMSNNLQEIAS